MKTETIEIEGMHCASCVRRVERALTKLEGVQEASVNLATNRAHVSFDAPATPRAIASAIERSGYTPKPAKTDAIVKTFAAQMLSTHGSEIRLAIAAILSIPILYWSMAAHTMSRSTLWPMALLAGIVVFGCGAPIFTAAWRALARSRTATMDTLIALGSSAAYLYSFVQTIHGGGSGVYYDTASMIVTFILLGRLLEHKARERASDAIRSLAVLVPKRARLVRSLAGAGAGEREIEVAVVDVSRGDLLRVHPGEKFAVDGVVVDGRSAADESLVTGESTAVGKSKGDAVVGGTLNVNGSLIYRATAVGEDTALARIAHLVEQAQASKAPVQRLADSVAAVFVPFVLVAALVTFIGWMLARHVASDALMHAVSVLVISCPCALGLATPTAIMVATGRGAQLGILLRNGRALEMLAKVKKIVFDKTGTLTEGQMRVTDVILHNGMTRQKIVELAASAERGSEHALGAAILDEARRIGVTLTPVRRFTAHAGEGVRADVGGQDVMVGAPGFLQREGVTALPAAEADMAQLQEQGKTALLMAVDQQEVAVLAVSDAIRPEAPAMLLRLRRMGIDVAMLSGDHVRVAESVADALGIVEVAAGVSPEGKLEQVKVWQDSGAVRVAMVGDGVNDAAALAKADVGIAMGRATDIASHAADVTLLNANLNGVPNCVLLGRRTMTIIRQNLFWAFIFNAVGIPLAAFGVLTPMIAAFAMASSSVIVVCNALRLRNLKLDKSAPSYFASR